MERYFFTVHDGQVRPDTVGTVLEGPDEISREARATLADLLRYRADDLWGGTDWKVVVTDTFDRTVMTVRLRATDEATSR